MPDSQIARNRHRLELHEGIQCPSKLIKSEGLLPGNCQLDWRERRTLAECSNWFEPNLSGRMLVEAALVCPFLY